jgi:hypothetical protein
MTYLTFVSENWEKHKPNFKFLMIMLKVGEVCIKSLGLSHKLPPPLKKKSQLSRKSPVEFRNKLWRYELGLNVSEQEPTTSWWAAGSFKRN